MHISVEHTEGLMNMKDMNKEITKTKIRMFKILSIGLMESALSFILWCDGI